MLPDLNIYQEERPWGNFRQFTHNILSTVKIITVKPGEMLSLQSHKKRSEFWRVIRGSGFMEIGGTKHDVLEGDEYSAPAETKHRFGAGPSGLEVLEISLGDFDENDIVRYDDKYGRI